MPTSSIFTNIVINDPEKVEKFIDWRTGIWENANCIIQRDWPPSSGKERMAYC